MTLVGSVNQILSVLTVAGQALILVLLIFLFLRKQHPLFDFFGRNALLFSFIVALIATLGSLFYSEIAGYEPCKLCWFQRILMYPQVIILAMALFKKDENVPDYDIVLSLIGAVIAGYHYLLQVGIAPELPCSAIGYSAACSQRFVMNFGYITIPMMAFTAFLLIIVFMLSGKISRGNKKAE
jgi:disulfide bond formation protein DsbB